MIASPAKLLTGGVAAAALLAVLAPASAPAAAGVWCRGAGRRRDGDADQAPGGEQARCGLGARMPFLVISPYAKSNYVDHTVIDQSSVPAFIEYNWHLPRLGNGAGDSAPGVGTIAGMFDFRRCPVQPLFLSPATGEAVTGPGGRDQHSCQRQ